MKARFTFLALVLFSSGCDSGANESIYYVRQISFDNFTKDTVSKVDTIFETDDLKAYFEVRLDYHIRRATYYMGDTSLLSKVIDVAVTNDQGIGLDQIIPQYQRDSLNNLADSIVISNHNRAPNPPKRDRSKEELKNQFSAWNGSHMKTVKWVKSRLHNPSSFEHVDTRYMQKDGKLIIVMGFRAENGFGATRTSTAITTCDPYTGNVIDGSIDPI